jgi:CheY-like chemotaxis protein
MTKRILLVEDKDVQLALAALDEYNLANDVFVARDGVEALDYLRRAADVPDGLPAVVFFDLKMPRLDGLQVLAKMKADSQLKQIPVVVLVESVKELGFFWALLNEPRPTCLAKTARELPIAESSPNGQMSKILIIDDEEEIRRMFGEALENAGYDVLLASNGEEGLRLFRRHQIDLVLLDIWMPEKDGLETLVEIRRSQRSAKLIAISGGGRLGLMSPLDWASRLGAKAILRKPFTIDQLLATVSQALSVEPNSAVRTAPPPSVDACSRAPASLGAKLGFGL